MILSIPKLDWQQKSSQRDVILRLIFYDKDEIRPHAAHFKAAYQSKPLTSRPPCLKAPSKPTIYGMRLVQKINIVNLLQLLSWETCYIAHLWSKGRIRPFQGRSSGSSPGRRKLRYHLMSNNKDPFLPPKPSSFPYLQPLAWISLMLHNRKLFAGRFHNGQADEILWCDA